MTKLINFEGKDYEFPDDASEAEIGAALDNATAPPGFSSVIKAIPGEAKRHLAGFVAGADILGGDVFGSEEMRQRGLGVKREIAAERELEVPKNMSVLQEGVLQGGASVLTQLPAMAVGGVGGVALGGLARMLGPVTTAMGLQTGVSKYGDERQAGFMPGRSAMHGLIEGLIEKYTEYLPLKELTEGNILWKHARNFLAKEFAGEQLATLGQDINAKLSDRPDMTLGEYFRDALVTAIATPIAGGAQLGIATAGQMAAQAFQGEPSGAPTVNAPPAPDPATIPPGPPAPVAPDLSAGVQVPPPQAGEVPAPPLFINALGEPQGRAIGMDSHGNFMQTLGVDNSPDNAARLGLFYMDSSGPTPLVISGGGFQTAEQARDAAQAYSDRIGAKVDVQHDQNKFSVMPSGQSPKLPKTQNTVRVYFAGENEKTIEATIDEYEAKVVSDPVRYVDLTFDQMGELAQRVSGVDWSPYGGTARFPLPKDATLVWKTALPAATVLPSKPLDVQPVMAPGVDAVMERSLKIPENTSMFNVEGIKASSIVFPNKAAKALWDYGAALTRFETTTKPADSKRLGTLMDRVKEVMPGADDAQISDTAQRYVYGVTISGLRKSKSGTFSAPTLENALSTQKAHEAHIATGLASQTKPGEVTVSSDLPYGDTWLKQMHVYLQAWVKTFSPQMRIVILGVQEGNVNRARTYYYGGVHYVYVPRQQQKVLSLYVLAHEFGHMLVSEHFNNPKYTATKDKLIAEYAKLLAAAPNQTSIQFTESFGTPIDYLGGSVQENQSAQQMMDANGPGVLTIDEWLADQFVRYVHTKQSHLNIEETKSFWKPLFEQLEDFFKRIVKKFAPSQTYGEWVESLRFQDSQAAASMLNAPPSPRVDKSVTNEAYDQFEYTTKVLNRLPNKPTVKKVTIYGELGRADVRKQERELVGGILHDWPGESVDANLFKERVLGEIVPLRLHTTDAYSNYGVSEIGYRLSGQDRVGTETHIWEGRGIDYTSPHFQGHRDRQTGAMLDEANSYWAHARGFVDFVPSDLQKGYRIAVGWNIIELQSDLEQHESNAIESEEARGALRIQIEDHEKALSTNNEAHNHFASGLRDEALEVLKINSKWITSDIVDFDLELIPLLRGSGDPHKIGKLFATISDKLELKIAEMEAKLKASLTPPTPQNLPKNWWELILRHEATWAAKAGYKRVRMASADTVAKVEGWLSDDRFAPGQQFVPALVDKEVQAVQFIAYDGQDNQSSYEPPARFDEQGNEIVTPFRVKLTGNVSLNEGEDFQLEAVAPNGVAGWVELNTTNLVDQNGPGGLVDLYTPFRSDPSLPIRERVDSSMRGIYDRYAKDITKFVKREFNAKEVVDDKGNTWLEWQTVEGLADMPIVYYNVAKAVGETGGEVTKKADVPDLPKNFVRFQGFLQNTLQLNQMAKILPEVIGLQRYRTAMRSLHALKAKLFEGPNDRIHEWHKIGRIQAKRVEQALRDEQLSGEHWTILEQVNVDGKMSWVHKPSPSFDKSMKERGISSEGQELFLGVKNDYLSTLTAMEEVVRRHTNQFFEKNELVLAQRTASINEEFAKLRATPYLPDMRFGKYSVQVRAGHPETVDGREIKTGELVYWEKFESERARNARLAELKRTLKGHSVSGSYDSDMVATMRGLPQSVMDAIAETLNSDPSTALSPEQTEALEAIAFDQTAAGKFAKYLKTPAKHTGGASKDMRRGYAAYHWKTANAIAKLHYHKALTGAITAVRADAKTVRTAGGVSDPYDKLVEYMQGNFNYVMTPQHEYEQLRSFVSLWYLWGSAKTAVMNMTSVPVLTFPYLWARFGNLQAQAALLRAMKDVAQYWRDPSKISADKQRVLKQFQTDGVRDQSFASMLASVSDGGVAFEKIIPTWEGAGSGEAVDVARRMAWKITSLGMMPFRVVEQLNRDVTGLAAYDLMVAKTGKTLSSGDLEAYNFARDTVDYTQNEYGAWNRPAIMQGKQSIFLLFFSFVQNMSFLMFGGDKSWWRAMMVMGALAGLQGLPGMDNILDMFNWAARKLSGQHVDLRHEARAVARELGLNPDMVMHGISHNWLGLGWDTSSSVGAGRIIPGTDAIFGVGKFENRFLHATSEIGGPVGSLMLSFLQALSDDNPSALLKWDRALPPVIRNIEKTYLALANDEWTNARGRPIAEDPTTAELVGQSLGFSPTRRTERTEELRAVKEVVEFYKERRSNLMEMMWAAKRTHDSETIKDVRGAIADFNRGVPSTHLRISSEDITASMKSRATLDRETEAMRSPQKRYRDIYRYIDELY
jgi:hypothetical protein